MDVQAQKKENSPFLSFCSSRALNRLYDAIFIGTGGSSLLKPTDSNANLFWSNPVIVYAGCYKKTTTDWVAYE